MRRVSVRRSGGAGDLWLAVAGLAVGVLAGVALRSLSGTVDRRRVRDLVAGLTGTRPKPASARLLAQRVVDALDDDLGLHGLAFSVATVDRGHLELHGWVPNRALRARAIRVATLAVPEAEIVNRLQVRDEDDTPVDPPAVQQPA